MKREARSIKEEERISKILKKESREIKKMAKEKGIVGWTKEEMPAELFEILKC